MRLNPGARLGPYEVVALVGVGGMGEVYHARDSRLKRDVAIKVLPSSDPDRVRRFEQEAQAAGGISHPNIIAVYDVGVHDGGPYIVSELLTGRTLREYLKTHLPPVRQAIEFSIQIARGLVAAHGRGITHRDLKSDNLFVTAENQIKILDFGLAKYGEDPEAIEQTDGVTVAPLTHAGMAMGTAGYMAPEQVEGKPADHRADIFAYGVVLYEMLTGARPFTRSTGVETMTATLRDEPPEPPLDLKQVPEPLRRVLRRCLAKRPEDRFQSARDLEIALEDLQAPLSASSSGAIPSVRRSRAPLWIAATLVALAAGLWLAGGGIWSVRRSGDGATDAAAGAGSARIRSLVVLPLDNFSADPEQEFFSDGMTEALIADLSRVGGLRVISRTSAMTYKAARKPLPQIARELNVDAVIEGSVMRAGSRVRITAQLIEGASERHLWNNTYERDLSDVLALQSEVARAITNEIKITLTPQEQAVLAVARPLVAEAHELYLRGRFVLAKGTEQAIHQAIDYFEKSIAKDPGYAQPYAGLADAYTALRSTYAAPHAVMPRAKAAAAKALELDPKLAAAHVSMGGVLMFYDYDWPGAERELTQAIALSPNLAEAHDYYALYLSARGRHPEAQKESAVARALDPLSLMVLNDSGWVLFIGRNYQGTIDVNRQALELNPDYWPALRDIGVAYAKLGRFPEALAALQRARALDSNPSILEMLAATYVLWDKKDEARTIVKELEARAGERYVCPYEISTVHAGLGDKKASQKWLEKGLEEHADCMPWSHSDPLLDSRRSDPEFADIIRRMGLPADSLKP
jgi:serine/threonine-protein kinase